MKQLYVFMMCSFLSACGPTVIQGVAPLGSIDGGIAVLPIAAESDMQREKLAQIQEAFIRELNSSGFSVLSRDAVNAICSTPECAERSALFSSRGVKHLLAVKLDGSYETNAVAGYYNALSGLATLINTDGSVALSVEHTESEKGGILFNTGQVIEAFRSARKGFEDPFEDLTNRFATKVVSRLPRPGVESNAALSKVSIRSVATQPLGNSRYRVCAEGDAQAQAKLIVNNFKYALRETKTGTYCTVLLSGIALHGASEPRIVLESSYGGSAQRLVSLPGTGVCNPSKAVYRGTGTSIVFGCDKTSGDSKEQCERDILACKESNLYVYSGDSNGGPYSKVGKIKDMLWRGSTTTPEASLAVLSVSPDGATSTPVQVE